MNATNHRRIGWRRSTILTLLFVPAIFTSSSPLATAGTLPPLHGDDVGLGVDADVTYSPIDSVFLYEEAAKEDPAFAGIWIDDRAGRLQVSIGVKGNLTVDPYSFLTDAEMDVVLIPLENSLHDLATEFQRIMQLPFEERTTEGGESIAPYMIYTDVVANRVVVLPNLEYPDSHELVESWELDSRLVRIGPAGVAADTAYQGGQR